MNIRPSGQLQSQQVTLTKFRPAYSYLVVRKQKTPVCFDDQMPFALKIRARSKLECIVKCTAMNEKELRGVNYHMTSSGTCFCFPKANTTYKVSASLQPAGCQSFVIHDCPDNFDYVIEYHKCYKMQYRRNNWYTGRYLCNNISSSHPILLEDDVENAISLSYVNYTTPNYSVCPHAEWTAWYTFFTGGLITYVGEVRTPFMWSPYPGVSKYVGSSNAWFSGEPNGPLDGLDYCIQSIMVGTTGWDDYMCSSSLCMLCEVDIPM
ncbi:hypothetical protein HELRODRAFT_176454 [Helobdella robusta]|uniref:C-type lectin domain-containing protein n=1 Tax=Helobdella robusta TaxID=6412 RepID=T1FAI8_HELRO|nr:hypothetical protein HELRODRAFT_176454 [Helobdella robusta]ESN99693.1 hypothetical protein HELRODRAFT_176454 [Helobdella robusta]